MLNKSQSVLMRKSALGRGKIKLFIYLFTVIITIGTQKVKALPPVTITLASATQVAAGTVCAGTLKTPVYSFTLNPSGATNLTGVSFSTIGGTYTVSDITKFQLWWSTTNNLSGASQISTDITTGLGPASHSFAAFTQALTASVLNYFWITTDIAASPANGSKVVVSAVSAANFTVSTGSFAGSTTAGGMQTIGVTAPTAAGGSICAVPGTVILTASGAAAGEDYKWYDALTGGTLLQTNGTSYTTPPISATTTYYVTKYNTTLLCESSPRTPVTATVNIAVAGPWSTSSAVNNTICAAASDQQHSEIVSDGSGGAFITWYDYRGGAINADIYAQRINAGGTVQWTCDGVAICTATNNQQYPTIAADGSGGAIITWQDNRNGSNPDIYAQRIDANGSIHAGWPTDGVAICTSPQGQQSPTITSDGSGGAVIAWWDLRSAVDYDIYAQRIDGNGSIHAGWAANGVLLCGAAQSQYYPQIASDGSGGAIIAWHDFRSGTFYDIYAQRIDASGTVQWTANGTAICSAIQSQQWPSITSDGSGGAVIAWHDFRNTLDYDIYAQRIDGNGAIHTGWATDGVLISGAAQSQYYPSITGDGTIGGTIITWYDFRSGTDQDIYAQRIDATGTVQWTTNGAAICTAAQSQYYPTITNDGTVGGAVITWYDIRGGVDYDIYAQRINAGGVVQWTANGVAVSTAANTQEYPQIVSSSCGVIITWYDHRSGTNDDIYTQQVDASGVLGGTCALPIELLSFTGHNEGAKNVLEWITASEFNNDYFQIERRSEGNNEWEVIGEVKGSGNRKSNNKYQYTDALFPGSSYLYYRLKQSDFDGNFTYSSVISLTMGHLDNTISIYPNPTKNSFALSFQIPNQNNEKITIGIYSLLGEKVFEKKLEKSVPYFYNKEINISSLPAGIYIVKVNAGAEHQEKKLTVME